jgi:hypothetical protein
MGIFKKKDTATGKGLEDLKNDFPKIKIEVSKIVVNTMIKCNVKESNYETTMLIAFEEMTKEFKKLGYNLTVEEVSAFLNSPQFIQMGKGNEAAGKLADEILKG